MNRVLFASAVVLACVVSSSAADAFKLMSYNVRHCADIHDRLSPENTAAVIARANPRFAALQEIDRVTKRCKGRDELAELSALTKMHGTFAKAIPFEGGAYGVALLSREKPLKVERFPLPGEEPRVLLLCEFDDCFVGCTHLSVSKASERVESVALMRKAITGRAKPVFLLGDWNSKPNSEVLRGIGAYMYVLSDTKTRTFHGMASAGPKVAAGGEYCIDYIAVDAAHAAAYRTVARGVIEDRVTSDHAPIFVTVEPVARP